MCFSFIHCVHILESDAPTHQKNQSMNGAVPYSLETPTQMTFKYGILWTFVVAHATVLILISFFMTKGAVFLQML